MMSDKELKELVASLAIAQKEMSEKMAASRVEVDERMAASRAEVDKQIKQTQKQLGELGNKWGTFTEGMAMASLERILFENFKIPTTSQRVKKRMNGESIEMDAFGYENSTVNTAVIVEIKSHLRDDSVEQIERIMED